MKTSPSRELSIAVLDEIGIDIDYVRHKKGASARLFFTGAELGLIVSTGVVASFFLGYAKGFLEGLGKEAGEATAKLVAGRLKKIAEKLLGASPADNKEAVAEARSSQLQLDEFMEAELPKLLAGRAAAEALGEAGAYELHEVKTYLVRSGMTEEIAAIHAERVVRVIVERWPPA